MAKSGTDPSPEPKEFSLSDGTDLDMDPNTLGDQFPRSFIPNGDGTLSVLSVGGNVVPIPVKSGAIYPSVVKRFRLTGTSGTITKVVGLE